MPAPPKETADKGECEVHTKVFRQWRGVNTKASRNAIPEDCFYDLVNLMPIGHANCHTVPSLPNVGFGSPTGSIYWIQYANINAKDYLYSFTSTGAILQTDIAAGPGFTTVINPTTPLSGAGTRMDQWKNQQVLFIDSTGYYSWDGTTFTGPISGGIIPAPTLTSPDISVFSNRVWIYSNRVLYVSSINSYTDFTTANGAITQNITDPQARGQITRMYSALGYLYLFFKSSVFLISDVYIPTGASPPAPVFSFLNVQATTGCDQPASVFATDRDIRFANTYGLWSLTGVTAQRISADIDGTIQYLDKSFSISGALVQVNNILNSAFLIRQLNDPVLGTRVVMAMYFDEKWWFASHGNNVSFIASALNGGVPVVFIIIGGNVYQAFSNTSIALASSWQTALWAMDDSIADKEVFRAGLEFTFSTSIPSFVLNVDSVRNSTQIALQPSLTPISWINNAGTTVLWQNNLLAIVSWSSGTYALYLGDAKGVYSKYVGFSGIALAGSPYELDANMMDYAYRRRW
jgi:hypothetical protein